MNWGTKLVIGMGLFMAFIVTLGTAMVMSNDDALIEENYYEKGLNYDKDYNEQQKAVQDTVLPEFQVNAAGLTINFPHPAHYILVCKRLSNAKMDQVLKGVTDESRILKINKGDLAAGLWKLELKYSIRGEQYRVEREITMP